MSAVRIALIAAVVLAGCGNGDGTPEAATSSSDTSIPGDPSPAVSTDRRPEPLSVVDLGELGPGEARIVLGASLDVTLVVETCAIDLGARPDGEVPAAQVRVRATGARPDGVPVTVDATRFRSQGAAPTITDTITVLVGTEATPERVVQAQRFEIDGQVTDPRDADADDPLLRIAGQRVEARGLFAPPGSFADDGGLVEAALAVACTG